MISFSDILENGVFMTFWNIYIILVAHLHYLVYKYYYFDNILFHIANTTLNQGTATAILILARLYIFELWYHKTEYISDRPVEELYFKQNILKHTYTVLKNSIFIIPTYIFFIKELTLDDWNYFSFITPIEWLKLLVIWILSDGCYYIMHILMHTRYLYKKFHKLHHTLIKPTSFSDGEIYTIVDSTTTFCMVLFVLYTTQNIIQLSPIMKILATNQWLIVGQFQHGGKDIPINQIPGLEMVKKLFGLQNSICLQHDKHHTINNCNYSLTGIYDYLFNTLNEKKQYCNN
jgi:lathosterol oxidase